MTTGKEKNVFNIAVNGNFDDCQNLVKSMFADKVFQMKLKCQELIQLIGQELLLKVYIIFIAIF